MLIFTFFTHIIQTIRLLRTGGFLSKANWLLVGQHRQTPGVQSIEASLVPVLRRRWPVPLTSLLIYSGWLPVVNQATCVSIYRYNKSRILLSLILFFFTLVANAQVSGTVFRDYNANGTKDTYEGGVASVTVTAYTASGTTASVVSTTAGAYSFAAATLPSGTRIRLEFSTPSASDYSGPFSAAAAGNGTSVQFVTAGSAATTINFAVNLPNDYCQANPPVTIPCYENGDRDSNANPGVVSFLYNSTGTTGTKTSNATISQAGSVWGTDYQVLQKRLFAGSFLKRHVDLGAQGLGGFLVLDYSASSTTPTASTFTLQGVTPANGGPAIDAGSVNRSAASGSLAASNFQLSSASTITNIDLDAYTKVGTVGYGDVDLDQTGNRLWTVNLNQQALTSVDVSGATLPGTVNQYPLASLPGYPTPPIYTNTGTTTIRIEAGGAALTDANGNAFLADVTTPGAFTVTSGTAVASTNTITNLGNPYESTNSSQLLYQTIRTGASFSYALPVVNGRYRVLLDVSDPLSTTSGQHQTTVTAESYTAVAGLDTWTSRDDVANRATTVQFVVNVTDGILNLGFVGGGTTGNALVAGIEVIPIASGVSGVMRPWGLGFRNGHGYLGVVSDASNSLRRDDLQAYVLEFDPNNVSAGFTTVLSFPLNYNREYADYNSPVSGRWTAWRSEITMLGDVSDLLHTRTAPSPLLSDIDFTENGSMVIGFMDRVSNQEGYFNNLPYAGTSLSNRTGSRSAGDILQACYVNGSFVLEQGNSGTLCKCNDTGGTYQLANDGPSNGGEFYNDDYFIGGLGSFVHLEIATGGLLQRKGSGEILSTVYDPVATAAAVDNYGVFSQGVHWYNDQTGVKTDAFRIVEWDGNSPVNFGKASGLGDPTLRCDAAPIQIGNRVWRDDNKNGIQDPGEPAIPGVVIALMDAAKTTTYASVTTNADGEYYFSSSNTAGISTASVATTALTYNTSYALVITSLGTSTAASGLTLTDVTISPGESGTVNSGATTTNNDATVVTGRPSISLTTGDVGENNHTYDFGLAVVPCSISLTAIPGPCLPATNQYTVTGTVNLTSTPASSLTITDGLVSTVVSVSAGQTSVTYSLSGLNTGTGLHTITLVSSATACGAASATYTAPTSCTAAPCGVAIVVTPGLCQSATNSYVLSGTITATNVPTSGTLTISSAAFTSRNLTVPAGNASGTFSYSGLVSNGQTYIVTASYSNSACSPVSQTYTAPVSCSVAPPCSLSATATAGICSTATNTYSATITASLTNAPAGTITLSIPGTTPVSQTIAAGAPSATFIVNGLVSNGLSQAATVSFPGCGTVTTTFTAPTSCLVPPACSLSAVTTAGICSTATNTYSATTTVTVFNPPAGGTVNVTVGGTTIPFTTTANAQNIFTATFTGLVSDGQNHTAVVSLAGCGTVNSLFTAPTSCSVAPVCSISAVATAGLCQTATNTYSSTVVVTVNNPGAGTLSISEGTQTQTFSTTASAQNTFTVIFPGLVSNGSSRIVTASLPGCSTTASYTAPVSCSVTPTCNLSVIAQASTCNPTTNLYVLSGTITITNSPASQTLTLTDGSYVRSLTANAGNTSIAYSYTTLQSDGAQHTVTVTSSASACGVASVTYTAPPSCSVVPACSLSAVATPGICASATNTYSTTVNVTLLNPVAGILTVSTGTASVTATIPATLGQVVFPAIFNGLVSDGASHTVVVSLPNCGSATTTYTAPQSCTVAASCQLRFVAVTPGLCLSATNQYTLTGSVSATNASGNQLVTITDGTVSTTVTLVGNGPASFTLSGLTSNGSLHTLSASAATCGIASTTYTAPTSCSVATTAGLGDYVFLDANKDGIQNTGDTPIQGVMVTLYTNGVASLTTVTNASGFYSFTGLTPGNSLSYSVGFTTPSGYTATLANAGSDDTKDSDADLTTGRTQSVTLVAGEFNSTLDAGYYVPAVPTVSLDKFVDKSKAAIGDVITYTIVVTNTSTTTATNVIVSDFSSAGLQYVANSATPPAGTTFTQGLPTSTWHIASLAPAQSLSLTLQAIADSAGILRNTATVPGDTATVCTTIPYRVCQGNTFLFQLTAPAGLTNYQWFRNGQPIAGAVTNTLDVSQPGSYSLSVNNSTGSCPDFSCCPFIVEEDSLPVFQATTTPATCVGNVLQVNGRITLTSFQTGNTYQYSLGTSFNEAASLSGPAQMIPADGVIVSNVASPTAVQTYTVRVYNSSGCYVDQTVLLTPTVCGCPAEVCVPLVIQQTKRGKRTGAVK